MSFYEDFLEKNKDENDNKEKVELKNDSTILDSKTSQKNSKISEIQKREEKEREAFLDRVSGDEIKPNDFILKMKSEKKEPKIDELSIPVKQGKFKKLVIRFLVLIIIVLSISALVLVGYNFYNSTKQNSLVSLNENKDDEEFLNLIEKPKNLINYEYFEYPLTSGGSDLMVVFSEYIEKSLPRESLVKISFQENIDGRNEKINLNVYLDNFIYPLSPVLSNNIKNNFNLFIHYKKDKNDFGFIVEVDESFVENIEEWENEMILKDNPFELIEGNDYVVKCSDNPLNFIDKVCYSLIDNKLFMATSSLETMNHAINNLNK